MIDEDIWLIAAGYCLPLKLPRASGVCVCMLRSWFFHGRAHAPVCGLCGGHCVSHVCRVGSIPWKYSGVGGQVCFGRCVGLCPSVCLWLDLCLDVCLCYGRVCVREEKPCGERVASITIINVIIYSHYPHKCHIYLNYHHNWEYILVLH